MEVLFNTFGFIKKYVLIAYNWLKDLVFSKKVFIFEFILLLLIAIASMLFFNHYDTACTAVHSNRLVELTLQGKFFSYYTIVNEPWIIVGNEPDYSQIMNMPYDQMASVCPAVYSIVTYITYGLWNSFFVIINLIAKFDVFDVYFFMIWDNVLICLCNVIASYYIYKIISNRFDEKLGLLTSFLFLSSGVLLYSSVAINQVDAIYVCIMIISFYFLFNKNNMYIFSLLIGLAASYKYIPLVIGLAVVALLEKDFKKIILNFILILVPIIFFNLLMRGDYGALQTSKISDFDTRLFIIGLDFEYKKVYYLIPLIVFGLALAYITPTKEDNKFERSMWYSLFMSSSLLLSMVWNPQWLLILVPFVVCLVATSKRRWMSYCFELCFIVGYVMYVIFVFHANYMANNMMNFGILAREGIVNTTNLPLYNFYLYRIEFSYETLKGITLTVIITGILGILVMNHPFNNKNLNKETTKEEKEKYLDKEPIYVWMRLLRMAIMPVLFILPSIYLYTYHSPVTKINNSYLRRYVEGEDIIYWSVDHTSAHDDEFVVEGWALKLNYITPAKNIHLVLSNLGDYQHMVRIETLGENRVDMGGSTYLRQCGFYAVIDKYELIPSTQYRIYIGYECNDTNYLVETNRTVDTYLLTYENRVK